MFLQDLKIITLLLLATNIETTGGQKIPPWRPDPNNASNPIIDWPGVQIVPFRDRLKCVFNRALNRRVSIYSYKWSFNHTYITPNYGPNAPQLSRTDPIYRLYRMDDSFKPGTGVWKCQIQIQFNWGNPPCRQRHWSSMSRFTIDNKVF